VDLIYLGFFFHPSCACSLRVQLALHYKGHPFVRTLVEPDQLQLPGFLELNPLGKLPVLIVHDRIFTQSASMIQYLDDIIEEPPLWPWEPYQKQEINEIINIITTDIQPVCNIADVHALKEQGFALSWIHRGLRALEKKLYQSSGNPHSAIPRTKDSPVQNYCFRNQVSAADFFFLPQIRWCIERNIDLEPYPVIRMVYKNLSIHPTIRKPMVENQSDTLFFGTPNAPTGLPSDEETARITESISSENVAEQERLREEMLEAASRSVNNKKIN